MGTMDNSPKTKVKGSFAATTWLGLIVGFLLLILLIIFILQNQQTTELNFFAWSVEWPAGVAFLIFAIAGALIMALVGGWRMFELRRQVKKSNQGVLRSEQSHGDPRDHSSGEHTV